MNLKHLTDKALLADIKKLAAEERSISVKVLHHLREIERRRLFSDLGYGSLYDYVIKLALMGHRPNLLKTRALT